MVVKVYKEALAKVGKTNHDLRLRIEHAQILVSRSDSATHSNVLQPTPASAYYLFPPPSWLTDVSGPSSWYPIRLQTVQDIEKAGKLGLIASFQPTHGTSDMGYAEERLGPERIKGAYAWQSLYE